ncbi:hypothetical protein E1180_09125 [Roseibium denhamense]|uniref:Anti-sigma factor NepR domain-containing protein n=1 Tax=Roseibium denhamense TaxID=76305 RepID=A0ABY1NAH1_9HYPH|nr:hypothetical protein [Roseibium denhamense]MTI05678.1 hypothetical protein [Roseibium denhamense]SMP04134.1 hypothetical protein SAMN06265374_0588 [Roseibium denhamense]
MTQDPIIFPARTISKPFIAYCPSLAGQKGSGNGQDNDNPDDGQEERGADQPPKGRTFPKPLLDAFEELPKDKQDEIVDLLDRMIGRKS